MSCPTLSLINPATTSSITHGDSNSVTFGIYGGVSLAKLRADKMKLDSGELDTCKGTFTVKFMTGEPPQHMLYMNSVCEINLDIEQIDTIAHGLQISGRITNVAYGTNFRTFCSGAYDTDRPIKPNWKKELDLLQKGTRIRLIHRGAAGAGIIICIQNASPLKTHFPYVPPRFIKAIAQANASPASIKKTGSKIRHHSPTFMGNGRVTTPYRI